jgi:MFS family permease
VDRNVKLLAVGVAIRTFGSAMYNPFLALFLYSVMRIGYFDIGVIITVVGSIELPCGLLGGLWADRVGRHRLILLGLATEALLALGLAYAFDVRSLALAVGLVLVGGSVLNATGAAFQAYIADFTSGSDRTRSFTWYRITFNGGYAAGVSLGGILVGVVGFSGALVVASLLIGGATLFVLALLRPSPYDVALASPRPVPRSESAASPPRRTLRESLGILSRDRTALLVATGFALAYVTAGQWSVTFPLFVHEKLGVPYALLGLGLAVNGVLVVVGQAPTTEGLLGRRHTTIAIAGVMLYATGFLILGAAALWVLAPTLVFFVAVVILTCGENVAAIPQSTLPSNLAPPGEVGAYNGGFNMFASVGAILGILLGGAVLSFVANPLLEWVLLCLPVVPAVLLLRFAARRLAPEQDRA